MILCVLCVLAETALDDAQLDSSCVVLSMDEMHHNIIDEVVLFVYCCLVGLLASSCLCLVSEVWITCEWTEYRSYAQSFFLFSVRSKDHRSRLRPTPTALV